MRCVLALARASSVFRQFRNKNTAEFSRLALFSTTIMATGRLNNLAHEKSPYLLQHVTNPVNWYPWGEEAFKKAKELNRPIFLSVGYSTCHWCNGHESFENEEIGKLLNENFVSIKVDREERPDVDRLYMAFVQAMSGSGGWPMSVFLTPDLEPIMGGTYFPPEDNYGRPGFPTILKMIADKWKNRQAEVKQQGKTLAEAIKQSLKKSKTGQANPNTVFKKCLEHLAGEFDEVNGGFGTAPKFPKPVDLDFLLACYVADRSSKEGKYALHMLQTTLQKMADGGIHDHVGKGFHRYSVDATWHVPHFEKMLYDQGQLLEVYSNFYKETGLFSEIVQDIADYLKENLTHPLGGFYSAEDADSLPTHDSHKKKEGAFCVWTKAEIEQVLGDHPTRFNENITLDEIFCTVFNVYDNGNVPRHADPHNELTKQNVLKSIDGKTLKDYAGECHMNEQQFKQCIEDAKVLLRQRRAQRPRPHLDNKILTSWNGLAISGLCAAASALPNRTDFRQMAEQAVEFAKNHLTLNGDLLRSAYVDENGKIAQISNPIFAFADDYAFLIKALLDLYELNFDESLLQWACDLQMKMDKNFWDEENDSGYYLARASDSSIFARMQEEQDGAEPSTNSIASSNLLRLASFFNEKKLAAKAQHIFEGSYERLQKYPFVLSKMVTSLYASSSSPPQIVVVGHKSNEETVKMLQAIQAKHILGKLLVFFDQDKPEKEQWLLQNNQHFKELAYAQKGDKPVVFICRNFACEMPVYTLKELEDRLN
uniref:DUF255 domain-containing protein n=1 Tax=Ditylenchus dipsaci TaxID=166011 RepID=A0A915EJP6_9BILA